MPADATKLPDESLRFPVGRYTMVAASSPAERARAIGDLTALPAALAAEVARLDAAGLEVPYRPGGWTVRQLVHHLADSHMNAYVRCKLALTEASPTVKPYDEAAWAVLPDTAATPVAVSLTLLEALHTRWVVLLEALAPADYQRPLVHPDHAQPLTLDGVVGLYAWHSRHHLAHVRLVSDAAR